jgi:hypothetical protein
MYVMLEGHNANAALHRHTVTFLHMTTNNGHLSTKQGFPCKPDILSAHLA